MMLTPELNKWCPPEVAKLWPEGSQIVWRIKLDEPSYNKHHRYETVTWFRPDWIGVNRAHYLWMQIGVEFMLLELPIELSKKGLC